MNRQIFIKKEESILPKRKYPKPMILLARNKKKNKTA